MKLRSGLVLLVVAAALVAPACDGDSDSGRGPAAGGEDAGTSDAAAREDATPPEDLGPPADVGLSGDATPDAGQPPPNWEDDLQPIQRASCGPCHTTFGSGGTNFAEVYEDNLAATQRCGDEDTIGGCGLALILSGAMPQGRGCSGDPLADGDTPGCLDRAALDAWAAWLAAGMPKAAAGGGGDPEASVGSCTYVNPFSQGDECKEYTGAGWTAEAAEANCQDVLLGTAGTFTPAGSCGYAVELGTCVVVSDDGLDYLLVSAGDDVALCSSAVLGCEVFGGGVWTPGEPCEDEGPITGGGYGSDPFVQPYLDCRDPLPGQPPGRSEDGKVCTWVLISGCTEEGRRFPDYASCDDVYTQRPYYGSPEEANTAPDDPRLEDADYRAELAWVKEQVEASACVCCHSSEVAPDGPSWWYIEAEPLWIDSVRDSGLAMMAGLAGSAALGAYPAHRNNGFDRTALGLPTTDIDRMRAFLVAEWARRGYEPEDGAQYPDFGGPIYDQLVYQPEACNEGVGVDEAGALQWTNGDARYAYVLRADASSPGVPPNLDVPEGTLWLVDVPTAADPFATGLVYGELAGDLNQRIPADGSAPPALQDGETYYLYVLKDVGFPLARCLFTYPIP